MQKGVSEGSIPPNLDSLLNDGRLKRLFSQDLGHCALQLWVLQIKSEHSIENRIIYGRLLPYRFSSDSWSASDDDNFNTFGGIQAQIIRLNLYVKSATCAELLRQICDGRTIAEISEKLQFRLPDKLKDRLGATALSADELVYRPVAYLINRDAHDSSSLSSPNGGAGAYSASITQTDKGALFRIGQSFDIALTERVVKDIDTDTGLDFGGADIARFGDIELLVFPALDDFERRLLKVAWAESPYALVARFNPMQIPHFCDFQFHLKIESGGNIVYSRAAVAALNDEGEFEYKFELDDQLRHSTDSTELEIFGFHTDVPSEGTLCCRWRIGYIREVHIQGHSVGHSASSVKFDWLEKTTRPVVMPRVKAALTINRDNAGFTSRVGGRKSDPRVPINRDLKSLFARLHPSKSEGRFFQRWGQGDGEGRLQLVEWFRALMAKHQQHQMVIFDPYFEDAGLGLILLCAAPSANYIVFTSLLKPLKKCEATADESDKPPPDRINNLLASCEHNHLLLEKFQLRIYGLKDGRLHDRYILIVGADNLPIAGFNLSNSFQNAAENYPLLITPIPADVLLQVARYKEGLVQEAKALQPEAETEYPSMRLLFDSATSSTTAKALRYYEPLGFLDESQSGEVLSAWTGDSSLRGMSGDRLRDRMSDLGMLHEGSLRLPDTAGFRNYLQHQASDFTDFIATWKVLGDVLAHSRTDEYGASELKSEDAFLELLIKFLETSFNRAHQKGDEELAVVDTQFFRRTVESLLHSSYHPHHLFHTTKYTALNWSEYFTIKFLWWFLPDALIVIAETQIARVPVVSSSSDSVRLSLLSQIVSEMSLSVQFDISEMQRDRLLHSTTGLLQWIGLNALERQLEKPEGLTSVLQVVHEFPYAEQIRALGWMVHRAARNVATAEIYNGLVQALHSVLPRKVTAGDLKQLVDSMRGHMRKLAWTEPWLSQTVVFPLLEDDRASVDDICKIWIQELTESLGTEEEHRPRLFDRQREGGTTNFSAFLFAHSSKEQQQVSLRMMEKIFKRQQRIIQKPLASTSDWTQWDDALVVSMWILTFTRWSAYYLKQLGITNPPLEELSSDVRQLVLIRPLEEWRSEGASNQTELAAVFDQAEGLLA